jgi:hypothetical protein
VVAARLRMYSISSARKKSFPPICFSPAPRLMVLRPTAASPFGVKYFHGPVHPAVRRSSRFCIPLLRPYRHQRLPEQSVAARAGGLLLPPGSGHSGCEQGSSEPANQRLQTGWKPMPAITESLWNGRKKACAKKITSCPRCAAWRRTTPLASTSSSGAWSRAGRSASACRSSPHKTPTIASWRTSEPLHPLLLLHPGRGPGADHHTHGVVSFRSTPRTGSTATRSWNAN